MTEPPRRLPAGGRRAKRDGSEGDTTSREDREHREDRGNVPDADRSEGASHRGRRAAYPPGWGAPTTTGPVTPAAGSSPSPASYRGRRAAYPPSEQGGTTEIREPLDSYENDDPDEADSNDADSNEAVHAETGNTEAGNTGEAHTGASWAHSDSWTAAGGDAAYDALAHTAAADRNGTHPVSAAPPSWRDPLTSDPLSAAPQDESPDWWTTHSRRAEPESDGEFEDPLGLAPAWSKQANRADTDAGSGSAGRQTNVDRQVGDTGAGDNTGTEGTEGAASAQLAAPSFPAGADAWEVATGRTDSAPALSAEPSTGSGEDERTISSVWERDFTQTTTMWGRYDSEPTPSAPAPPVPGAADVELSEAGIADHGTTGVTDVGATDPALRPDAPGSALGSAAPASDALGPLAPAPLAPEEILGRFDLDEPLTGTAPIESYSGPQPPWMRYGAADDLSLTEAMATTKPASSAAPGPVAAPAPAEPAIPPPAEPRSPRPVRRPLWRDEAEPEPPPVQRIPPRSAQAERRSSAAVEDTHERHRSPGLPGLAAIGLGLGVTVGAGVFDLFWTGELGLLFSVCFGLVAFGVAASIRRSDIFTAAVLPPLELLLTLVTLGLIAPDRLNPSAANQLEAILSALAASWITLVAAVLITFGVLVIRWALGPRPTD